MSGIFELGAYEIGEDDVYDDVEALLGSDEYEMLGAKGRRPMRRGGMMQRVQSRRQSPQMNQAMANRIAQNAQVVRNVGPTRGRVYPLGIDSVANVAAAATLAISTIPQVTFRVDYFLVASSIAASFIINDIKVGNKSQLASSGSLPAEAFSNLSFNTEVFFDTAQIAQTISVSVTNFSGAAARFLGMFKGPVVE